MDFLQRLGNVIKNHIIITIVIVEAMIVVVLGLLGFRITYNPEIINDWGAIEAVGTWISGLIIPFAVIWVQKKIDDSERRTGASNTATIDEIMRRIGSQTNGDLVEEEITDQRVYNLIKIHVVISSEDIAKKLGVDVSAISENLITLYANKKIWKLNGYGDLKKGVAGCKWKIR